MKQIYVCGDSFAVSDPDYGDCWVDLLCRKLQGRAQLHVLARVCASNLHIALQLDRAIQNRADYVIWLATSSVRHEVQLLPLKGDLLDNFVDPVNPVSGSLANYSMSFLQNDIVFSAQARQDLEHHVMTYVSLDTEIYRNELMIDASHARLHRAHIPYSFDQGGFEHASFGGTGQYNWPNRSALCLWDYVSPGMPLRPYFHIEHKHIHDTISDSYLCMIEPFL